jgi:hypothetical protein
LHFYEFSTIYYVIYKIQVFNPRSVDVVLQKGPRSKTKITIGSPVAEQGWPAARGGRNPASERPGWGLDSPSVAWCDRFGGKSPRRRSAAREAVDGRGGRNAGELAVRPANACAREGPRGCG